MLDQDSNFRELMDQVSQGSEEAAWQLVDQYGERVRRAVRCLLNRRLRSKFDSMDFVQLVWSSLFRAKGDLDRFDRPEELAAFLMTMARNKVGMEVRRRMMTEKYNVNRETSLDGRERGGQAELSGSTPEPIDVAIARERWQGIVEERPEQHQQIVKLRLQGYTHRQIADEVGISERTVRRFLQKLSQETFV
ncbi:MAG: sigma-70 family RNA polymerase sigma factor [Pirellulales bacterium]|nr:sigma-70 family RNA polymerase sigma factor [Pirellulales bacterium]